MDLDPQIVPVINAMQEKIETIKTNLLPKLDALDEDLVVSHYSLEEQARLFLAAAFATSLSMYSLDKLQNRAHPHDAAHAKRVGETSELNPGVDLQLALKIERITDYIKKLREITDLANERRLQQQPSERAGESASAKVGEKRPREESAAKEGESRDGKEAGSPAGGDFGDEAMFRVVSRVPGEVGRLVSRLLTHTTTTNTS
ncbi:unnamed protein product [Phytomonas sp. EM1]|nr:unnamed protein product [Phytomonas sp. EM1]|eukprot:CCW61085.1 unnamed protein product [Phytomonas sp. isolate EM1]